MGNFGGSYTLDPRNLLDESKRILGLLCQIDKPWSDIDDNLREYIYIALVRRLSKLLGDGAEGLGWKPTGTGANNNLTLKGGGGTDETALSFWLKGYRVAIHSDIVFDNAGATDLEKGIHSASSGLTALVLTDLSANFKVGELVGRELRPDITDPTSYTITANDQATITVGAGDMTSVAGVGDNYLVEMVTAGVPRTDYIWMIISFDEISGDDDSSIKRDIEGTPTECKRLLKLSVTIHVRQGDSDLMPDYTDGFGNKAYTFKLGEIDRLAAQAAIDPGDVTDQRPLIGSLVDLTTAVGVVAGATDYTEENYIVDGDPLQTAIDKIDQSLYDIETWKIFVLGYKRFNTLQLLFADASLPVGSEVIVFSQDDSGSLVLHAPNKAGTKIIADDLFVSFVQSGNLVGVFGRGDKEATGLRSILINSDINLENLYINDKDTLATYGVRLIGSNDIALVFSNVNVVSNTNLDESGFTGTETLDWRRCEFYGGIAFTKFHTSNTHYIRDCKFFGSVSFQAASSISIDVEECYFSNIPTLTNIILNLRNCFIGDTHYSFARLNNTGLHSAAKKLPVVTTVQRDAIPTPVEGMIILNSTLGTPQIRNAHTTRWFECVSRDNHEYHYYQVPAGLTDQNMWWRTSINQALSAYKGYIVGLSIQSTLARSGGSLTGRPTINGTPVGSAPLDVVLDNTNPQEHYMTINPGITDFLFGNGDKLGVAITSTAGWLPVIADVFCVLYVVIEGR